MLLLIIQRRMNEEESKVAYTLDGEPFSFIALERTNELSSSRLCQRQLSSLLTEVELDAILTY